MAEDIVCAEAELSIAANNIVEYADFLVRTMETYTEILSEIQEKGIQDDLVCSKLSSIVQQLKPYMTSIPEECESIRENVSGYITGVAVVDRFVFPGNIGTSIASIVSQFL